MPIKVYDPESGELTNGFNLFKEIGLKSYQKFLSPEKLESFTIICPEREASSVKELFGEEKIPFKVMAEEDLLMVTMKNTKGWFKQQIIKLAIAFEITTPHYLVIDSDHFLTQPLGYSDLFTDASGIGKKVKYHTEPWQTENSSNFSTNSNWWISSCKILNHTHLPTENLMGVTPQVLITDVVKSLVESVKNKHPEWQSYLCSNSFTEFTLYWVYILQNNLTGLYLPSVPSESGSLWKHDKDVNVLTYNCGKNKVRQALEEKRTAFSVIQGYIKQDITPFINEFNRFFSPFRNSYKSVFLTASMLVPNRYQSLQPSERLTQTIETLLSIKRTCEDSFCILIEASPVSEEVKTVYEMCYDHVIYTGLDESVTPFVNHPKNIGHGEMKLLEKGVDWLLQSGITGKRIFKLGARYALNSSFKETAFSETQYTFKKRYDESVGSDVYITGLYGIPSTKLGEFRESLIRGQDILSNSCNMIEKLYVDLFGDVVCIETLGLEGMLSYNREGFSV